MTVLYVDPANAFDAIFPGVVVQVFKRVNICEERKTKSIFCWQGFPSFSSWFLTNCPSLERQTIFSKIFEGSSNGAGWKCFEKSVSRNSFCCLLPVWIHPRTEEHWISQTFHSRQHNLLALCYWHFWMWKARTGRNREQQSLFLKPSLIFE